MSNFEARQTMERTNTDDVTDPNELIGEYTLQDTYDHLKDIQRELRQQMEELMNVASNNQVKTLPTTTTPDNVRAKQQRLMRGLLDNVDDYGYDISHRPIPNSEDDHNSTIRDFEQHIVDMEKLLEKMRDKLSVLKKNIVYLENEKNGWEKMKEASIDHLNSLSNVDNDEDTVIAKRLFQSVKKDLALVVDIIFPDHVEFREILGEITSSYLKKGDDVYVAVAPEFDECIKFLIEADIATYHPNDKNRVRLMDLI